MQEMSDMYLLSLLENAYQRKCLFELLNFISKK